MAEMGSMFSFLFPQRGNVKILPATLQGKVVPVFPSLYLYRDIGTSVKDVFKIPIE